MIRTLQPNSQLNQLKGQIKIHFKAILPTLRWITNIFRCTRIAPEQQNACSDFNRYQTLDLAWIDNTLLSCTSSIPSCFKIILELVFPSWATYASLKSSNYQSFFITIPARTPASLTSVLLITVKTASSYPWKTDLRITSHIYLPP